MAAPGVELICGARRDEDFGYVVMVGLGGTAAEVLRDVSFHLAPLDLKEGRAMLYELRSHPLLFGARGTLPCDIDGVAKIITALSRLVLDFDGSIREIDLNPLLAPYGSAPVVVDALIIVDEAEVSQEARTHEFAESAPCERKEGR
jgi:hypothetical protein